MNTLTRVPAVFLFEWRRVLTFYRIAGMALLALFPAAADVDSDVGTAARSLRNRICDFVCPVTMRSLHDDRVPDRLARHCF